MELNINKCKVLRVSRIKTSAVPSYNLNNSILEFVPSYRYLGVHISSDLTWSIHIDTIINNANRTLGYLRRNFSSAPVALKTLLYQTLVRSKLEYASPIWDPSCELLTNSLERVQNNATRFIYRNYSRTSSVTSMKKSLCLPELATRRRYFRICFFHKIFYHTPALRTSFIPLPSYVSSRSDHQHKVGIMHCHTKTCSQSFIPRTSQDWNHLPGPTAAIAEPSQFRRNLVDTVFAGAI